MHGKHTSKILQCEHIWLYIYDLYIDNFLFFEVRSEHWKILKIYLVIFEHYTQKVKKYCELLWTL